MRTKFQLFLVITLLILLSTCFACQKLFLDRKPDKSFAVPASLQDLDALLNNEGIISFSAPALQQLAGDEFFLEDNIVNALSIVERNSYLWADDFYESHPSILEWNKPYEQIFHTNIVLDELDKIPPVASNQHEWHRIKGSALFFRATGHFHIAQLFAEQYDSLFADQQLGIPIRLTSDVNDRPGRGTLKNTYDHILRDLMESESLLPEVSIVRKTRPDKASARAMLARVCLTIEDYLNAGRFADSALKINNKIMDFNHFDLGSARPIPTAFFDYDPRNVEVLQFFSQVNYGFNLSNNTFIHSALFEMYDESDLRKRVYFNNIRDGYVVFKGNYNGLVQWFSGLTTAEMYLIRAESNLRIKRTADALSDMNELLRHRILKSAYEEIQGIGADELLELILEERRKELVARGIRWSDMKRLNKDVKYAKTIYRTFRDEDFKLLPNSAKYVFPIPAIEIELTGMEQNSR